ncbi:hypothetical protein CSC12_0371 [Klebsiella michiganensis]|nr:hypothetical protein A225_2616 [Klebsiella michiganensis E718]AWF54642.1 hypothetical protein CSC12_0371 [Klebsiella michiganensis]
MFYSFQFPRKVFLSQKSWAEASGKGSDLNENEYQRNE